MDSMEGLMVVQDMVWSLKVTTVNQILLLFCRCIFGGGRDVSDWTLWYSQWHSREAPFPLKSVHRMSCWQPAFKKRVVHASFLKCSHTVDIPHKGDIMYYWLASWWPLNIIYVTLASCSFHVIQESFTSSLVSLVVVEFWEQRRQRPETTYFVWTWS